MINGCWVGPVYLNICANATRGFHNFSFVRHTDIDANFSWQIQRNLQLRIEEQGRHLQMMFEKQRKLEDGKSKVSSSSLDDPTLLQSDAVLPSGNDKSEISEPDHAKTVSDRNDCGVALEKNSPSVSRKHKALENGTGEDLLDESSPASTKRARANETAISSTSCIWLNILCKSHFAASIWCVKALHFCVLWRGTVADGSRGSLELKVLPLFSI